MIPRLHDSMRIGLLVLLSVGSALVAQRFVVDPNGGGQYRDLQTAIQAVPSGAILEVRGGAWGAIQINGKSLTIYGNPRASLRAPDVGSIQQPPALRIRGFGSERVVLANLDLGGGQTPTLGWSRVAPALDVDRVDRVTAYSVSMRATEFSAPNGIAFGVPGALLRRTPLTRFVECRATGSLSWPINGMNPAGIPTGAAGIETDGDLELVRCDVSGGAVYRYHSPSGRPSPNPCPCPGLGGRGGDAVRAARLRNVASRLTAGLGTRLTVPPNATPWGQQAPGLLFRGGSRREYRIGVAPTGPMRIGTTWSADLSPKTGARALVAGVPSQVPVRISGQDLFFDARFAPVVLPVIGARIALPVPNTNEIIGGELAMQLVQPAAASGPHFDVVRN